MVRPANIDETPRPAEMPAALVERLARAKAAAARPGPGEVAMAADTEVVVDGEMLGKPVDDADAARMLRLSPAANTTCSAASPCSTATMAAWSQVSSARASLSAPLSEREIAWYVRSGEPLDKAGAYAIQGLFALFAVSVTGNYTNVVGLPLPLLYGLLSELGVDLLAHAPSCKYWRREST